MRRYPALEMPSGPLGFPSAATALEQQLGLTLHDTTAPYDVIAIDSAQWPDR